ncbi:MAG: VOC family protein [Candidatus Dadabacteria bacterium]|nr:VOC family protein [Candidatus Dadabacteria bacterium]
MKLRRVFLPIWFFLVLGLLVQTAAAQKPSQKHSVKALDAISMTVSNIDRSVDFYSNVLSFKKVSDIIVEGDEYDELLGVSELKIRVVRMQLGDEFINLIQYIEPSDGKPIPVDSRSNDLWFQHFAIVVKDMDKAYELLRKYKVSQISTTPQTIPKSNKAAAGISAFKFKDPDGHPLELLWFPPGKGDPRWHSPTDKLFLGIDHTAIGIGDTKASLKFYRDLLGMSLAGGSLNAGKEQEQLDNVPGAVVRITALRPSSNSVGIEFLEYETPSDGRALPLDAKANDVSHWQTVLMVDNVDATEKWLRNNNVRFVSDRVSILMDNRLGFKSGIKVLDPDGHAILIVEE